VRIAIENNVVTPGNASQGAFRYLGVIADEILSLLRQVDIGLLLDVAHLKVSAASLGFCPSEFIRKVASKIEAVHLSDNNGLRDSNDPIHDDSWFWEPLRSADLPAVPWVLEVYNQTPDEIHDQLDIARRQMRSQL
jgi:uncharacterized protein (UPF0276 family)